MAQAKRPLFITLASILFGFTSIVGGPVLYLSGYYEQYDQWYSTYLMFIVAIQIVVAYGLWNMKRWSIQLYLAIMVIGQLVAVARGEWTWMSLLSLILTVWFFKYIYKQMT